MKLVAIMLGKYPGSNARDPASYHDALAAALCDQPRDIAIACANLNGVVTECMFKPTVADIVRWCARETAPFVERMREHNAEIEAANAKAKAAPLMDRKGRPSYEEMQEKLGKTFGLKLVDALDRLRDPDDEEREKRAKAERAGMMNKRNHRAILAEYASLSIDPVYASDGTLASPSLLRSIDRMPRKPDNAPVHDSDR
jgi:hypothetical protein